MDKRVKPSYLIDANGVSKKYKSMYAIAKFLNVSKGTISYNIDRDRMVCGFFITSANPTKKTLGQQALILQAELEEKQLLEQKKYDTKEKISYYNDEVEAAFRKLGYYDSTKLLQIKNKFIPIRSKT